MGVCYSGANHNKNDVMGAQVLAVGCSEGVIATFPKDIVLKVVVPLVPQYSNELVNIHPKEVGVEIPLQEGEHTYESPMLEVGVLRHAGRPVLHARLIVSYNYNPEDQKITLYGTDFESDKSLCLHTRAGDEEARHYAHSGVSDRSICHANRGWNYSRAAGLMPGLHEKMRDTVRKANDAIIQAAKKQLPVVCVRIHPPEMPYEPKHVFMMDPEGKCLGTLDEDKEWPASAVAVHVSSTFYGEITLDAGEAYANVIGSSGDPYIDNKSWIELWERQFNMVETECSSHNWAADSTGIDPSWHCNDASQANRVGGHCVLGKTAKSVPYGADGQVFIIPICKTHNGNDNVYMNPVSYNQGILLNDYHQ